MQHFSGEDEEHCLIFLHVKHTGKKEVWKKKISAKKEREEKKILIIYQLHAIKK